MKIALLEDDPTLGYGIKRYLTERGHEVHVFSHIQSLKNSDIIFDIYLIDIQLPDGRGTDYVAHLRKTCQAPVIYLSALDDENTIISAFDLGGDDYITKPFSLAELERRITAITRRVQSQVIVYGTLKVDMNQGIVTICEENVSLSAQEYRILLFLLQHQDELITHDMLYELLDMDPLFQDNAMNVALRRLRKKVESALTIQSVHGKGYKVSS